MASIYGIHHRGLTLSLPIPEEIRDFSAAVCGFSSCNLYLEQQNRRFFLLIFPLSVAEGKFAAKVSSPGSIKRSAHGSLDNDNDFKDSGANIPTKYVE